MAIAHVHIRAGYISAWEEIYFEEAELDKHTSCKPERIYITESGSQIDKYDFSWTTKGVRCYSKF